MCSFGPGGPMRGLLLVTGALVVAGLASGISFVTPNPVCYSASVTGFWYVAQDDSDTFGGTACRQVVNWLYAFKELETQVVHFTLTTPRAVQVCDWPANAPLTCNPEGVIPARPGDHVEVVLTRSDSGPLTIVTFAGFTNP